MSDNSSKRGLGSDNMSEEKKREIQRKGGQSSHGGKGGNESESDRSQNEESGSQREQEKDHNEQGGNRREQGRKGQQSGGQSRGARNA